MECKINYYDYRRYKNDLAIYIHDMLSIHKKDIIDSFVEYFGEKNRALIEERYESITSIFCLTPDAIFKYIKIQEVKMPYKKDKLKIEYKNIRMNLEGSTFLEQFYKKLSKCLGENVNLISSFEQNVEIMRDKERKSIVLALIDKYKKSVLFLLQSYQKSIKLIEEYFKSLETYNNKLDELESQLEMDKNIGEYLQLQRLSFNGDSSSDVLNFVLEDEMIVNYSDALKSCYYDFKYLTKRYVVTNLEEIINNGNVLGAANIFKVREKHKLLNFILVKLFFADDNTLIHEITHSISNEILFYDVENDTYIIKKGYNLNIDSGQFTKFVELVTQEVSNKVTQNLHNKGIYLLDKRFGPRIRNENKAIDKLFDVFGEYIKEGFLTLNANAFIERVGKENFEEFASLAFNNVEDERVMQLIQKMKKHSGLI